MGDFCNVVIDDWLAYVAARRIFRGGCLKFDLSVDLRTRSLGGHPNSTTQSCSTTAFSDTMVSRRAHVGRSFLSGFGHFSGDCSAFCGVDFDRVVGDWVGAVSGDFCTAGTGQGCHQCGSGTRTVATAR